MSSFSSAILKPVRRRLGFASVIAASAFATALITGNSTAAVIVAIAVVVVGTLIARAKPSDTPQRRARGEPYSASYEWKVDRAPDLTDIAIALSQQLNLQAKTECKNKVVLRGGSQFWLRLIGGYFIDPKKLPVQAELKTVSEPGTDQATVQLSIRDVFGVAVRDEALEDRFTQAARNIREVIETQLNPLGGVEP